jgi:hypothetical protein
MLAEAGVPTEDETQPDGLLTIPAKANAHSEGNARHVKRVRQETTTGGASVCSAAQASPPLQRRDFTCV